MLRFTQEQTLAVNAARETFNLTQERLGQSIPAAAAALVGNAAQIPLDAWRRIDTRGAQIQRDVLAVFNRLSAANQTPLGIGDIVSYFPKIGDSGEVHVSMDGRSEGKADQALVKYEGTPVPIFDSFARFGWRQMAVMSKGPNALDTETVANHQRKIAEKLEDMVLNGLSSIVVGGSTIYGLLNFPQRNTDTHGVTLNSATGAQWLTAVGKVQTALEGDNAYGVVTIFVNYADWSYARRADYATNYPKTIAERLAELGVELVPASKVPANELIGIANLSSGNWGSILSAMPMTTRPKMRHNPEDDYTVGVMASCAPQFRSDYDGRSSIAHVTAS